MCCCICLGCLAGPFISYVDLAQVQQLEQQLKQQYQDSQHAAGDTSAAGAGGIDWTAVGGRSLHEQQDVWGSEAGGRHGQL
jgi:hypothetical protein